jgi:centromeric protein E
MELVCIISLYWSFTLGQKGTVVEKLTEETLRDWNHFKELLSICIAQRQIGETALNEVSSRSHQILRLVRHSADLV